MKNLFKMFGNMDVQKLEQSDLIRIATKRLMEVEVTERFNALRAIESEVISQTEDQAKKLYDDRILIIDSLEQYNNNK